MQYPRYSAVFALLMCVALAVPAFAAPAFTGLVTYVADGDTLIVRTKDKKQVRVRLYGIDCPEHGQAFGNRARQATTGLVHGKTVTVHPLDVDNLGRTVAIVESPEIVLQATLLATGMAWVYPRYCKLQAICDEYRRLEEGARAERRGLWRDKKPVPPWEWRRRTQ